MILTSCSKEHKHRTSNLNSCFCRFFTLGNFLKYMAVILTCRWISNSFFGSYKSEKQTVGSRWQRTPRSCSHRTSVHNQLAVNEVHKMEEKKKKRLKPCHATKQCLQCLKQINKSTRRKRKRTQEKHPKLIHQQKTSEDHVFTVVSKWKARFIVTAFAEVFT